ncbi:MAG: hypothetical protein A3J67_02950 [Parcubacteria group bacterium RIFCSPHIGHO2_02_FULL_48_10b]|nr:MAG: hypothetical protein A3J67_02950 [Parcubacteria group bacterium RIFCSPHIGHO2_02_FULL_48_10b]
MSAQQLLIRTLANILFFFKRREFKAAKFKFLIFTGTVGKTTLRDAVTYALRQSKIPVESNKFGYSNELGILLTTFDYSEFSLKNPLAWFSLLNKKPPEEAFVCIELGADFYRDIKWFLKKFDPFAVFISGIASDSWSRDVKEVFEERKCLLEAVDQSGFVFYNLDDLATVELIQKSDILAQTISFSLNASKNAKVTLNEWSRNVFTQPITKIFNKEKIIFTVEQVKVELELHRPIFEPQVYGILATFAFIQKLIPDRVAELKQVFENYEFSKNRLQIFKARNGALTIEDSYKATPFCTYWFVDMSARILARKKILVITEMRPLTFNVRRFYSRLADKIKFAELVYFIGPSRYFNALHKTQPQVKHLDKKSYRAAADEILKNSSSGDLILLKGSFRYQLNHLRDLLV